MTPPPHPPDAPAPEPDPRDVPEVDDLDLAASDLLDGVGPTTGPQPLEPGATDPTTPIEPAAVEARAAQLRTAVDALAEPIQQPDTTTREAQIRRALAAGRRRDLAPAVPPEAAAGRSRAIGVRARRAMAAAAAILVVLLGAVAVAHLASNHEPGTQTASVAGSAATTTEPGAQPDAALPQAGTPIPSDGDLLADLGSFADADALVARARQQPAGGQFSPSSGPTSTVAGSSTQAGAGVVNGENATTCLAAVRRGRGELGPLDLAARATLAGQPVEVFVFRAGPAPAEGARVLAVRPTDCHVVVDRPL